MSSVEDIYHLARVYLCRSVKQYAEGIAEEARAGRDLDDVIHEILGGCEDVIYIVRAQVILLASNHSDAMEEDLGERGTDEQRAYWALCSEVREYLDRHPELLESEGES